jgi:hypothetical protein
MRYILGIFVLLLCCNPLFGSVKAQAETDKSHFIQGVNYVGSPDRAWTMWSDDKFDPLLIERDFKLVANGGFNSVRLFVREELARDILVGNFSKLDTVFSLAEKYRLSLVLTFADYGEGNLDRLSMVDKAIVVRYAGKITGYDLKNEPQLANLILDEYSNAVPLQELELLSYYGERVSLNQALSEQAAGKFPGWANQTQVYRLANYTTLYHEMLKEARGWSEQMKATPASWEIRPTLTYLDYFQTKEAAKWMLFYEATNQSLSRWLKTRLEPLKGIDSQARYTVGYNDHFLAALPANRLLDFVSIHTYGDAYPIQTTISLLEFFKRTGQKIGLEEFGYSNYEWMPDKPGPVGEGVSALFETALWLYLYQEGFTGGYKWMLYDAPPQPNRIEASYGLLRGDYSPKPAYYAAQSIGFLRQSNQTGGFKQLESGDGKNVRYLWQSKDKTNVFGGGTFYEDGRVILLLAETHYWSLIGRDTGKTYEITISTGAAFWVWLDLEAYTGELPNNIAVFEDATPISFERDGNRVIFTGSGGKNYRIIIS